MTIENSTCAVIGLHGWMGDERTMKPVAKFVNAKTAKWYLPRAPYPTGNGNGFSWFQGSDKEGWEYKKTFDLLDNLIEQVRDEGISEDKIFIIGFSQGASLSIEYALRLPFAIGGIVPIAGFIKFKKMLALEATNESINTSVFLMHGEQDEIVPVERSMEAKQYFSRRGHKTTLHLYSAKHKIPISAAPLIRDFIENR